MKFKTTSKAIRNGYGTKYLFQTGYCNLQNLFRGIEPIAYNRGIYGWNYDLYEIDGVGITTGYRNMVGRVIPIELVEKYENAAEAVVKAHDWKTENKKLQQLRNGFIEELRGLE